MVSLATGVPCGVYFTSGSLPRLPISCTRLRLLPAMIAAPSAPEGREIGMPETPGFETWDWVSLGAGCSIYQKHLAFSTWHLALETFCSTPGLEAAKC